MILNSQTPSSPCRSHIGIGSLVAPIAVQGQQTNSCIYDPNDSALGRSTDTGCRLSRNVLL